MSNREHQNMRSTARSRAHGTQGFSLIELLIVVAIILIIASIAIPNFLRSRMAANEAAAAANLRTITSAAVIYNTSWSNGFPPTLAALGGASPPATCDFAILIDSILATAPHQKTGYTYDYVGQGPPVTPGGGCGAPGFNAYLASATPIKVGMTGQRSFCSTTPGVIHYDLTGLKPASTPACNALPSM